ncbi:MAG: hypothetical protein OEW42_01520 [Acidimicrobiia bacterium]|nr:hypothetical protein [Acidimicrobiia bacterium]
MTSRPFEPRATGATASAAGSPHGRAGRRVLTVVVVLVLALPVIRDHDSFPLSTYPMYAHNRDRVAAIATVVGIGSSGQVQRLGLTTIADSDDPLEAASFVLLEIRAGRADALCAAVASRVDPALAGVEVVTETHDLVALVRGQASLQERAVHATCTPDP